MYTSIQVGTIPILSPIVVGSIQILPQLLQPMLVYSQFNQYPMPCFCGSSLLPSSTLSYCANNPHRSRIGGNNFRSTGGAIEPGSGAQACYKKQQSSHEAGKDQNPGWPPFARTVAPFALPKLDTPQHKQPIGESISGGSKIGKNHLWNPQRISYQYSQRPSRISTFTKKPLGNQVSLLGPHPSSLPLQSHSSQKFVTSSSSKIISPQNNSSSLHKKQSEMSEFTEEDEDFIQKFIGLSTVDLDTSDVVVPQRATSSTNWDL